MSSANAHPVILASHASTPCDAIHGLDVWVTVTATGVVTFRFCLRADMARIRVPSEGEGRSGQTAGLWKHTCFEAFIRPSESCAYYEFNFSPAGQWAAYRFDSYREGMTPLQLVRSPEISVRNAPDRLELEAMLPVPISAAAGAAPRPKLAIAAVVEEENGRLCYWAARHPAGRPDFHHSDGFVLEL